MTFPYAPGPVKAEDFDGDGLTPEGYAMIDVRENFEFEAGHAPGAIHIPADDIPDALDDLPDEELIIVCRAGGRARKVAEWLNRNGFDSMPLVDGMLHWQAIGLPLASEDGSIPEII